MRRKQIKPPVRWLNPPDELERETLEPAMSERDSLYMAEIANRNANATNARINTNTASTQALRNICVVCGGKTKSKERLCGECFAHFGRDRRNYSPWLLFLLPDAQREIDAERNNKGTPFEDETTPASLGGVVYTKPDAKGKKNDPINTPWISKRPTGTRRTAAAVNRDNQDNNDRVWDDPNSEPGDIEAVANKDLVPGRTFSGVSTGEFRNNGYLEGRDYLDESIDRKIALERFMVHLTDQEREIFGLYQDGYTQDEIAREVGISQARISYIIAGVINKGKQFQK